LGEKTVGSTERSFRRAGARHRLRARLRKLIARWNGVFEKGRAPWLRFFRGANVALLVLLAMLAACAPKPWEQDPEVEAAKRACQDLPEAEQYACIEDRAVGTLNPDVCRLASKWIDDMCLQSVYQAADDPAICERLYPKGVRPTCRDYYQRPAVDFVTDSVLSLSGKRGRYVVAYQVAVTHWGNRSVEDFEAYLVFPEAAGLPAEVELEETTTAPADMVEPNRGLIYEGKLAWETDRSKDGASALLDGARIRVAWTFEGEREEAVLPLSTETGPEVFPTRET